jgi:hypothetical protein
MPTTVKRDGITIIVNPIPTREKVLLKKSPSSGVLECERCRREDVNAVRDEGGWELWFLMARYTDLCPECVPKVEGIVGESRRVVDPQYMEESESDNGQEDVPF